MQREIKRALFQSGKRAEEIKLTTGIVTPEMMRKTSYVMVEVPNLERTIMVCDEEGNITYVLDSSKMDEKTVPVDKLLDATKIEINEAIENTPGFGRRVKETKDGFIPNLISAIEDLSPENNVISDSIDVQEDVGKYLEPVEKAPEGVLPIGGIAKELAHDARDKMWVSLSDIKSEQHLIL